MLKLVKEIIPIEVFKRKEAIVLLLLTFSMLVFEYFGWQGPFHHNLQSTEWYRSLNPNIRNFYAQIWTTGGFFLLMVWLPIFVLKFVVHIESWLLASSNPMRVSRP